MSSPDNPHYEQGRRAALNGYSIRLGEHQGWFSWLCSCGAHGGRYLRGGSALEAGGAHLRRKHG